MSTNYQRAGQLRVNDGHGLGRYDLTTPQKLMIFVLSMALFGLSNIILEIVPDVSIGPFDFSVAYFVFVPLTMAALFAPFWVALGAPLGEIIFTDLLMGDFSGLAEVEGFLQMFLAIYVAGSFIRNPQSRWQITVGALLVVVIDKFLSAAVDLSKVWIGVEDAEYVDGLPESMLFLEGIGVGIDILMSGILFGVIPALWLIPAASNRSWACARACRASPSRARPRCPRPSSSPPSSCPSPPSSSPSSRPGTSTWANGNRSSWSGTA